MAIYVMEKDETLNPCCGTWKEKYTKLQERFSKLEQGRNALRKGLSILEPELAKTQAENASLKKALEDERTKEKPDKDDTAKKFDTRVALENEVSALKSEIFSLKQNGESEINRLKELLEKEKERGDLEQKKADEAVKRFEAENNRANEEKRLADDIERRKTKEFRFELEALKCQVDEAKLKLALVTAKSEETNNELNAERKKTTLERKHTDREMAKVEEERKVAEANWKMALDERSRSGNLSQQLGKLSKREEELEKEMHILVSKKKLVELPVDQSARHPSTNKICSEIMRRGINAEEARKRLEKVEPKLMKEKKWSKLEKKKAEEQKQVAEALKKVAMEEKHHSDQLSRELGCYKQRLKEVKEEIQNLISSRIMVESSNLASNGRLEAETAKMKLLSKKLKFEKLRVKHAKEVAKMGRGHNQILGKQVFQLKQDLVQFMQRLDTLGDYVLQRHGSTTELEKLGDSSLDQECYGNPSERNLSDGNVAIEPSWTCIAAAGFDQLEQKRNYIAQSPPSSGEINMRANAVIQTKATKKSML